MLEIVTASAGAGKTYTLASRFLTHLADARSEQGNTACCPRAEQQPYAWNEILAITFTNKAAAEMQQRVLRTLKQRALGQDTGSLGSEISREEAGRWVRVILRRMGSLNIRTIDSLLHQVLRLGALQLALPPDVELEFDLENIFAPLYAECIAAAEQGEEPQQELLDQALDADFRLHGCSKFLPSASFRENVAEVFKFLLSMSPDDPAARLLDDPELLQEALLREYDAFLHAARGMHAAVEADRLQATSNFLKFLDKCLNCGLYDEPPSSAYAGKPGLTDCVKAASRSAVSPQAEAAYSLLKERFRRFATLAGPLKRAQSMAHLARLCQHLLQGLPELLRARSLAPAARLPHLARVLLADEVCCNEALCRMGAQLAHLLIDEFQDTSRLQWAALKPLAEEVLSRGGVLFYVGDVKQAIYRWRGGEASLFADVPGQPGIREHAEDAAPTPLPHNWRSSIDVVETNNAFFSQLGDPTTAREVAEVMLDKEAPEAAQAALAELLTTVYGDARQQVAPVNIDKRGFVHLEPVFGQDKADLMQRARLRLESLLLEELGLGGPAPAVRPRDVAILVRTNKESAEAARWCLECGLSVITENSLLLREHPLVQQMTALLAFLDYPRDDLAFWDAASGEHLLLGACGLESEELHSWLAGLERGPLYRRFRQDYPGIWREYFEPLFQQAGFMSAYDVLCDITARFRLLERHPTEELYIRRLLETAHAAEEQGALSLAAFLELWKQKGDEQKVPLPENLDAVRVLTIHKSKGLEFPIVIMPFHHGDDGPEGGLAAWEPADLPGPVLAQLQRNLGDTYYAEAVPRLLEQLNLLYVGWTRAERGLYALLTCTKTYLGRSPLLRALQVLLPEFNLSLTPDGNEDGDADPSAQPPGEACIIGVPVSELGLAPGQAPAEPAPPRPAPLPLEEAGHMPMDWLPRLNIYRSELDEANFEARKRGTLAHRCLEYLQAAGAPAEDVRHALRAGLRGHGDPHDPAAFATDSPLLEEELAAMLAWVRSHPELEPLLQQGRGEQEILTPDGDVKRVDFLAWDAAGPVAVEYKTGGPSPDHEPQLRRYLELLAAMPRAAGAAPRGLLVYLDEQRIQPVEG